jgi:hypothetical protein
MHDRPTLPPAPPLARTRPLEPSPTPIPPAQVWTHLTRPQQEAVRQALLTSRGVTNRQGVEPTGLNLVG